MRPSSLPLAVCLAAALVATAARAGDSNPPAITHSSPAALKAGQPLKISAHITDESRIFPQVFFRFGQSGAYEAPLDLKKTRGQKDDYEATLPNKPGPVDYYIECYDEFGNGPARAGSPEAPLHVLPDLHAELPISTAITPPSLDEPAPAPAAAPAKNVAASAPAPIAQTALAPAPAPAQPLTLRYEPPAPSAPITAAGAAWRSAVLPGWGQLRDERRIRGLAFGVATGASLIATIWLQVRAHQANTIYESAPLSVRSQAYDQAVSYADARNSMLGVTIGLYVLNVAEAYFLHGTKDP